ncbi:hypothetical protein GSB46_000952 [Salmonella enterica]|nr:hypothetical protein [Salmonella enterica]
MVIYLIYLMCIFYLYIRWLIRWITLFLLSTCYLPCLPKYLSSDRY